MDFVIKKNARDWFRYIKQELHARSGKPAPDFDALYFCFIAGVMMKRKARDTGEKAQLTENFPGPYRNRGRLLIALFLSSELEYLGVTMEERRTVHSVISELVNPNSPNFLSDKGMREFTRFAHGGFEVLREWFGEREPNSLESFLRTFHKKITSSVDSDDGFDPPRAGTGHIESGR